MHENILRIMSFLKSNAYGNLREIMTSIIAIRDWQKTLNETGLCDEA